MLSQYINLNKDVEQVYVAGNDKKFVQEPNIQMAADYIQQNVLGIKMQ